MIKTSIQKVHIFTRDAQTVYLKMSVYDTPTAEGIYGYALEDNGFINNPTEHPIRKKDVDGCEFFYIDLNLKN